MVFSCCVAHHIRVHPEFVDFFSCSSQSAMLLITSHPEFEDFFSCCSQSALLHITSEITLNFWTPAAVLHITSEIILSLCTSSAAAHSLLCCMSHQRSSWVCGFLQLLLTICCVSHHVRDHPEFLDFFSCCLESTVLQITSEMIRICELLQLLLTLCCVAHHIRDRSKFVDFFSCCSQSAVFHITSEIILNLWTSAAVHNLLFCTSHQRWSWISGLL